MPLQAITNAPYLNRIQLTLGGTSSPPTAYVGPFVQSGPLGAFNPVRDLSVYVDGVLQTIQSASFDANNNRYLIYAGQTFNTQGFVQVIHHVPNPPFVDANSNELTGFALIGSFIPGSDVVQPQMVLTASPSTAVIIAGEPVPPSVNLLWVTVGVGKVQMEAGGSPPINTGFLGASGIYILSLIGDSAGTIVLTMTGYDSSGNPILVGSPPAPLTVTTTVTITLSTESFFLQEDGTSRFLLEDGSGYFILEL